MNERPYGKAAGLRAFASLIALACFGSMAVPAEAAVKPVTWDDIVRDHETPGDVLTYGLGLKAQRHSPLKQINRSNVANLVPAWSFSFGGEKQRGQEAQALVHDGVIYVTASYSRLFAIDARTGRRLWTYEHRLPDDIRPCCDVVNRGPAIYGDKVFFGTLDARMIALDRNTGKVVWNEKFGDHKVGYTMTGAPFIVRDARSGRVMLIHGSSGDEFGVVGYLFARDPDTGKEIWARPMVEGHVGRLNGKPSTPTGDAKAPSWPRTPEGKMVEAWHQGGGAPWQTPSFDLETNTIVVGTGNPAPWNTWKRTGPDGDPRKWDNLYTSGQAYVDPTTGELKGFFQHTPNDAWDFSGNNSIILFEYTDERGRLIRAGAHADRNGFFFVTDRTKLANGAGYRKGAGHGLINVFPFVEGVTWASGWNMKTGRPIVNFDQYPPLPEEGDGSDKGPSIFVSPPFLGGTNWMPMSYSPETGLFYIPANHWAMDYWTEPVTYKPGAAYLGQGFRIKRLYDDHVGILRAVDPRTGRVVWQHKEKFPLWAGTLTTAGGLVFTGTTDGYVKAFDAASGEELWKFQTGSGVVSVPITWEMDGEQYIGLSSGFGGAVPLWGGDMAELTRQVTQGGSFWVFKLPK